MYFDKIVSLGSNCECAWNINNHFKFEHAYPFNWLITPHNSTIELLKNKFSDFGNPDNLEVVGDRQSVRCTRYNILHHHDFPREAGDKIAGNWRNQGADVFSKCQYLGKKFITDFSTGINLFVRNREVNEKLLAADVSDTQPGAAIALLDRLDQLFPEATNYLLCVNMNNSDLHDRILHAGVTNEGDVEPGDYRVSPRGWSNMFNEQKIFLKTK